jgi:hypothetical protein
MLDAGIVDQNVETAVLFHHICNHPGNRIGLRHIGSRITRRHAEIFCERGADLSHLRWTPKPVQNDSGPRFCQRARDAKANPTCGAGHERHFAVEVAHGAHPGGGDLDIHEDSPSPRSKPEVFPNFRSEEVKGEMPVASRIDARRLLH